MANDELIADLQRVREEIVKKRGKCLGEVDSHRQAVEQAKDNLRRGQEQERRAVQKDEDTKAEQKRLIDHLNGLIAKPQVLLERVDKLGQDQLGTYRERKSASEITRQRQRELEEANRELALAELDQKKIEGDLADVDVQIQQVRGYRL